MHKKLWQGCGKNPDFTAKTDITDKFDFNRISKLRVYNGSRLHPAYRLIRHILLLFSYLRTPSHDCDAGVSESSPRQHLVALMLSGAHGDGLTIMNINLTIINITLTIS